MCVIDFDVAFVRRWRRGLECVAGVAEGDSVVLCCAQCEEESHTWLFKARGVSLGLLAKPWGRTFRTVKASAGFASAIGFDAAIPNDAEDVEAFTRRSLRSGHGSTNKRSLVMGVPLFVEAVVPN